MTTRKQHVVPQFYLRGFSRDGKSWASRKESDREFGNPFVTGVNNLCSRRDYYEVKSKDASGHVSFFRKNSIENWLSSLEDQLAQSLKNVTDARTTDALQIAVRNQLYSMRILLANLIMRNPMVLNPSRETSDQFANALIANGFITDEELRIIKKQGVTPRNVAEHAILQMELQTKAKGSSMDDILSWLDDTGTLVIRARVGLQFVTADVPFALGWEDAKSELPGHIYMPLDWRTAIIFHRYGQAIESRYADTAEVDFWNSVLTTRTDSLSTIIAKSETALRRSLERRNVEFTIRS